MRGRIAPNGESAAALRLRAYQQKMAMRAQRAATAAAAPPPGAALAPAVGWVGLGPAPLASDATGNGSQDYNWVSGRATSVLIDPADNTGNTVLLGGAYGGLWKSTNAGNKSATPDLVTWQALIDDQPTLAVGAIALQPGNSNVILVGTGETNSSGDSYYGLGILRSTDGGSNWSRITSAASGQSFLGVGFSKIAFSTANPNLAVAATAGDLGFVRGLEVGTQAGRGLYYSTDAGATWNRVILSDNVSVPASVSGVIYNPNQGATGTFYASVRRHGLYSSTDGQHFTRLTTQPFAGLAAASCPASQNNATCQVYRSEFAVVPGRNEMYVWIVDLQPDIHQHLVEVDRGIWRTTNGGTAWTQISETGITSCGDSAFGANNSGCGVEQGTYNLELAAVAVPNSTTTDLYAGTVNIYKCTLASGGTSCTQGNWLNLTHVYGCSPLGAPAHVHPDQHGLAFMVAGGKAVGYFAHDGGISRALDGFTGLTTGSCTGHNQFDSLSQTLGSMTEFVSFSVHPTNVAIMLGGTQDNGSPKTGAATSSSTWQNALSGDGGFNAINPNNGNEWFTSSPLFPIWKCELGTSCDDNSFNSVVDSNTLLGDVGAFYTPYILDPQNTGEMLVGTCRVWRVSTSGTAPIELSNDFDTLGTGVCSGNEVNLVNWLDAGGPKDTSGNSKVIYAVTDGFGPNAGLATNTEGEVWVTTNAGATLTKNVTLNVNPNGYSISSVAIDRSDPTGQTAYVGIMGFHTSHVWKTTNAGTSWTDWSGSGGTTIPDAPVQALLVDSLSGKVYAGTDAGAFVSSTSAAGWTEVGPAPGPGVSGFLPNAPVTAIRIFDDNAGTRKLRVSTYGRGIWEFNLNVTPDFTNAISNTPQTVFLGQTATFNGTLTALNGYSSPVTLSCGAGAPGACTFPLGNPITPTTGGAAFSVAMNSGAATTDYNFNIHSVGSDTNTVTHDTPVTLHVVDFGLTAPGAVTAQQGGTSNSTTFNVTASGAFAGSVGLSCPSGLPAGAACVFSPPSPVSPTSGSPVTVTLTVTVPANAAVQNYTVTLQAITAGAPAPKTQTFTLTVTAPPNFTWTGGGSHTVLAGQSTLAYSFTATPSGAATFATAVTFGCSNLPDTTVTCAFSPTQIAAGAGATPVTLTITTKGPNPGTGTLQRRADGRSPWLPMTLPIAGIIMVGFVGRKVSRHSAIAGLCVALALLGLLVACGGGSSSGPPPPPAVSVTVTPGTTVSLYANEAGNAWPANLTQQQFTAVVNNSTNQTVTWAVTGGAANGSVDATGLYSAPTAVPNPANVTVTATAQAGGTPGTGKVSILTPTVLGTFPSITVTATEGVVSQSQTVSLTVN